MDTRLLSSLIASLGCVLAATSGYADEPTEGASRGPNAAPEPAAVLVSEPAAKKTVAETVDVNRASARELTTLPGIGETLAKRIVEERQRTGRFTSLADLARVKGLSSSKLSKLEGKVIFGTTIVTKEGAPIRAAVSRAVLERFATEPTVREVQVAALTYSRSHPRIVDSWFSRVRTNALMPKFATSVDGDFDRDTRTRTNLDATEAVVQTLDNDNSLRLGVSATWDLNRIVFDEDELKVSRESVRLANLRDRVLDEVTQRYFERRRVQIELELTPPTDLADRLRRELRMQELTGDIDALTGGWFSEKLRAGGQEPY